MAATTQRRAPDIAELLWQRLRPRELAVALRFALLRARYPQLRGGPFSMAARGDLVLGPTAEVHIGRGVRFSCDFTGRLHSAATIGARCFFNRGCMLVAYSPLMIGEDCLFGEYSSIHDANHALTPLDMPIGQRGFTIAPITIGRNVWVGAKATILPGVTIGENTVVGANAVVTRSLPANVLAVGSPAHVVRSLDERPAHALT
jgi:acetyltransferase-like isoleucine patch superfamily enzyme